MIFIPENDLLFDGRPIRSPASHDMCLRRIHITHLFEVRWTGETIMNLNKHRLKTDTDRVRRLRKHSNLLSEMRLHSRSNKTKTKNSHWKSMYGNRKLRFNKEHSAWLDATLTLAWQARKTNITSCRRQFVTIDKLGNIFLNVPYVLLQQQHRPISQTVNNLWWPHHWMWNGERYRATHTRHVWTRLNMSEHVWTCFLSTMSTTIGLSYYGHGYHISWNEHILFKHMNTATLC